MARCKAAIHLLPQSAKGTVGAGFAVSSEFVSGVLSVLFVSSHSEALRAFITGDQKAPRSACMVLDFFFDREVLIVIFHLQLPPV
jgi:hypothetical protein